MRSKRNKTDSLPPLQAQAQQGYVVTSNNLTPDWYGETFHIDPKIAIGKFIALARDRGLGYIPWWGWKEKGYDVRTATMTVQLSKR